MMSRILECFRSVGVCEAASGRPVCRSRAQISTLHPLFRHLYLLDLALFRHNHFRLRLQLPQGFREAQRLCFLPVDD
jgi:hypothetical protein